jgi:hypothetical protein
MTESDNIVKELAEKTAIVNTWIAKISEKRLVGEEVTPDILKTVLGRYGADFEPSPELETLSGYSNLKKRPGLNRVWGKERVNRFKKWVIEDRVSYYEQKYGHELPTLFDPVTKEFDNVKYSGMIQFLGELTAYAAGKMSYEKYKRSTEDRVRKGGEWIARDPKAPYEPTRHAAFLPEFALDAWNYIKATKAVDK